MPALHERKPRAPGPASGSRQGTKTQCSVRYGD
jgi:hypothetical protein